MINVKKTITSTIKDRIDRMRKIGENGAAALKKTLTLVIMDDVFDWAEYLDAPQSLQKKLKEARVAYILNNSEFLIEKEDAYFTVSDMPYIIPEMQPYVNVNTPQSTDTWKRVWDAPTLSLIEEAIEPIDPGWEPWDLDYSCKTEITYYINPGDTLEERGGEPKTIKISTLSTCEKMNVYINRDTQEAFYLDNTDCLWKPLKGVQGVSMEDVIDKIEEMRQGIKVEGGENYSFTHSLTTSAEDTATVELAQDEDLTQLLGQ